MRALVSADDVLATAAAHLDHGYDAARRLGCPDLTAREVVAAATTALVDDLLGAPETVGDLVGGLFGRCRRAAAEHRRSASPAPATAVDGADEESRAAATALAELPERRRLAVLLLDAYGVTYAQAAVALGLDAAETARTVALGRAALVQGVDGRAAPSPSGHDTAVGDLGMLSDGSAPAGGRFAGLRKHVSGCATCAEMLGVQTRGKAMVGALPLFALPGDARLSLLAAVHDRARAELPSAAEVAAELAGEVARPRLIPVPLLVVALLVAAALGVAAGAFLVHRGDHDVLGQRVCSISATRNASSIDCPVFSRGSQAVS